MDLHREADRVRTDTKHLIQVIEGGPLESDRLDLALSIAKRVRRTSTLLVKALAKERDDQLQPGGTS